MRGSQGRAALLAVAFVAAFAVLLLSCGGSLRDRLRNSTDCITQSLIEAGFKQPSVQVYSPETIFEYIDGEADVYLEYHFQTLMVIEAKQGKDRDITIEVYSMASPTDAMGIFSVRNTDGPRMSQPGAEYCQNGSFLEFYRGRHFVRVYSISPSDPRPIAMAVDRCLAPQTGGGDERGIPISR
ncbi:MAG: DUF6599 family protein [Candidatus Eisenbacteria bacterium]